MVPLRAQNAPTPGTPKTVDQEDDATPKRIFGIIPNYRTSPSLSAYEPLTAGDKFKIAAQDSFDRGTIALAAAFAGESQITAAEPSFGQGAAGYGRYFGTSYADFVIGDFMTEAVFPTALRQDPRYFRRGKGSGASRLGYACGQIFWTHSDTGRSEFNYSEVGGNATAVAISNGVLSEWARHKRRGHEAGAAARG